MPVGIRLAPILAILQSRCMHGTPMTRSAKLERLTKGIRLISAVTEGLASSLRRQPIALVDIGGRGGIIATLAFSLESRTGVARVRGARCSRSVPASRALPERTGHRVSTLEPSRHGVAPCDTPTGVLVLVAPRSGRSHARADQRNAGCRKTDRRAR